MKKLLVLTLATLAFAACNKNNSSTSTNKPTTTTANDKTCICYDEDDHPVRYEFNSTQAHCDSVAARYANEAPHGCVLK